MIKGKEKEFIIIIKGHRKGDRYEGDWSDDKRDGKGIYYYNNGDCLMGDYSKDKHIGRHVGLSKNGEIKIKDY